MARQNLKHTPVISIAKIFEERRRTSHLNNAELRSSLLNLISVMVFRLGCM